MQLHHTMELIADKNHYVLWFLFYPTWTHGVLFDQSFYFYWMQTQNGTMESLLYPIELDILWKIRILVAHIGYPYTPMIPSLLLRISDWWLLPVTACTRWAAAATPRAWSGTRPTGQPQRTAAAAVTSLPPMERCRGWWALTPSWKPITVGVTAAERTQPSLSTRRFPWVRSPWMHHRWTRAWRVCWWVMIR